MSLKDLGPEALVDVSKGLVVDEDGLAETGGLEGGSPQRKVAATAAGGGGVKELNEDDGKNNKESGDGGGSLQPSPCHSWISNSSSCTNLFEDDDDEECEGDGGRSTY